jgi:hypothetical protein
VLGLADGQADRGQASRRGDAVKELAQLFEGVGLEFVEVGSRWVEFLYSARCGHERGACRARGQGAVKAAVTSPLVTFWLDGIIAAAVYAAVQHICWHTSRKTLAPTPKLSVFH